MRKLRANSIRLIAIFLVAGSLSACAGIPKPEGHIGVVHSKVSDPYIKEFDMQSDFDDEGNVLPTAKGIKRQVILESLDKGVWMSSDSYANLRASWEKLKSRYKACK